MKIHTWFRSYKVSRKKKENENEITLPFRIKTHQLFLSPLCFSRFVFYFVRRSLLPTRLEQANNLFLFCIVLYFFCSCFFLFPFLGAKYEFDHSKLANYIPS